MAWDKKVQDEAQYKVLPSIVMASNAYEDAILCADNLGGEHRATLKVHTLLKFSIIRRRLPTTKTLV